MLATRNHARFEDAATAYLVEVGSPVLGGAVIAMAGLVDGDRLSMTNGNWVLSRTALAGILASPPSSFSTMSRRWRWRCHCSAPMTS